MELVLDANEFAGLGLQRRSIYRSKGGQRVIVYKKGGFGTSRHTFTSDYHVYDLSSGCPNLDVLILGRARSRKSE